MIVEHIKRTLRSIYSDLVDRAIDDAFEDCHIGASAKRFYVNVNGYLPAYVIRRLVGDKQRVLIIGDWKGRDTDFLRAAGKDVFALDIAPQGDVRPLVIADVTQPLPFAPASFDAIVMSEVLEHLLEDFRALRNVAAVLGSEGHLVVSVPYMDDRAEVHVRVHTRNSIRRLLEGSGFGVEEIVERGGVVTLGGRPFMYCLHLFNLGHSWLRKKTLYHHILPRIAEMDYRWGRRGRRLLRWTGKRGVYIKARRSSPRDFLSLNVGLFSTSASDLDQR